MSEQVVAAAVRAAELRDWSRLEEMWWNVFGSEGFDAHPGAATAFTGIPEDVRRRFPILTWARAVALAEGAPKIQRDRAVFQVFLRDALALHAGWRHYSDTDAAVLAGTMWLISQQRSSDGGQRAQDDAWATRTAVAALIADRRQRGQNPSDETAALFHAKSAQLALMRAEVETTLTEADQAVALLPVGGAAQVSTGIRALALELYGNPPPAPDSEAEALSSRPDLLGAVAAPAQLANLTRALRLLDRDAAIHAVEQLEQEEGEPCWPLRVALAATVGAIWDDPEDAISQLNMDLGRSALLSTEHLTTLGRITLTRVRTLLLCKADLSTEAVRLAGKLEPPWSWVALARAQLWVGDLDSAIDTARSGLFVDPATWPSDRVALTVIKAAALTASKTRDPEERRAGFVRAQTACSGTPSILALALLPDFGLRALLDYHDDTECPGCMLCDPRARERLSSLLGSSPQLGPIHLTRRERELLPLLASDEPVPVIAKRLHLSVGTVRKQVAWLRAKFAARSRQELIRRARATGHLRGLAETIHGDAELPREDHPR